MVNSVACFLTCGYTEAGDMQGFLNRCCRSEIHFHQCLPNKPRRRKGSPKLLNDEISGLTHESLLEKVISILQAHQKEYSDAKGILFEDDLDDLNHEQAEHWVEEIRNRIQEVVGHIPVIILLAAPEIESWFIADWENGFGQYRLPQVIGKEFSIQDGQYLDHHFKKYVETEILGVHITNPEECSCRRPYRKLSEEIIQALEAPEDMENGTGFRTYLKKNGTTNLKLVKRLISCEKLRYSKKEDGSRMLRNIDPDKVSTVCVKYFQPGLTQIRMLNG